MTYDSVSYRVLGVSELARLIACQLTLISQESVVNLACACRYLEEPVLSALWEIQRSLYVLLGVLPEETRGWKYRSGGSMVRVLDLPSEKSNA